MNAVLWKVLLCLECCPVPADPDEYRGGGGRERQDAPEQGDHQGEGRPQAHHQAHRLHIARWALLNK